MWVRRTCFGTSPSKRDHFLVVYGKEFEKGIDACAKRESRFVDTEPAAPAVYVGRILASYRKFAQLYVCYPDLAYTYVKEFVGAHTGVGQTGFGAC